MSAADTIKKAQHRALWNALCERGWCSRSWAEECIEWDAAERRWYLLEGVFPPGGAATSNHLRKSKRMRACPACNRTCPPDKWVLPPKERKSVGIRSSSRWPCVSARHDLCCDCEIATQERAFASRLKRGEDGLWDALEARWWARARTCTEIADAAGPAVTKPKRKSNKSKRKEPCPWCGECSLRRRVLGDEVGWDLGKAWKCTACGTLVPLWWFERDTKRATAPALADKAYFSRQHEENDQGSALCFDAEDDGPDKTRGSLTGPLARAAFGRLFGGKREEGVRAPGCRLVLLVQDDEQAQKEIAYYRKTGRIMPSARRYSQANPHRRAPEDEDKQVSDPDYDQHARS